MANTRRFDQLSKRISKIENSYLPAYNLAGNYTSKQYDDLRAYLLLAHAEIESYFEEISEKKAKDAFSKWQTNRTKSNVLIALVSFCEANLKGLSLEDRIHTALTSHINRLKMNHGIKEKNLCDILLPIGLEYSQIDVTWLSMMSSLGADRGKVAHSTVTVQQPLDPATLKNTLLLILSEIKNVDEAVKKLN